MENNYKQNGTRLSRLFFIAACILTHFFTQLMFIESQSNVIDIKAKKPENK